MLPVPVVALDPELPLPAYARPGDAGLDLLARTDAIVSAGGFWPHIIQNFGWGTRDDMMATQWLAGANGHYRWTPRA